MPVMVVVSYLVDVAAVRPVAGGSGRAGSTDVAGVLRAVHAGHALKAGVGGAAGAGLVEAYRQTGQVRVPDTRKRPEPSGRLTTNLTLQDGVPDQRHLLHLRTTHGSHDPPPDFLSHPSGRPHLLPDVLPQFPQDLVEDDELTNQSLGVIT